ncbi:D-alanine--D-alanine ligase [Motiliproteus coralliicola]|uniref:D-alanine--D-alanine ligase n=1 Tax=Motiliproteus coralliicola TaxID=2283196 RepID=A0A369WQA1_9GAMM|nr:D-alanine--D-alanine ligase [Motiliproteus coralliicola]RDE22794.1 D-alanine--D-alanine ligase [Motiliproteus coralliicola]
MSIQIQPSQRDPGSFGRVVVLYGGRSSERAVSLKSGAAVLNGLLEAGVDAFGIDLYGEQGDLSPMQQLQAQPFDRAFIALHGPEGEDGTIQGALEIMGKPYTGSGVMASALGMDKVRCKQLWLSQGLPTPSHKMLDDDSNWAELAKQLPLPAMVKPDHEGSSIGITRADTVEQLERAYRKARELDRCVFAERLIEGAEFTVAVLNGEALPVIRLETPNQFYDYEAKYLADDTHYHFETGLSEQQDAQIRALSEAAFAAVGCQGWGRVDLMQDTEGGFWLLEVNTVPGMTDHSLVPMAAGQAGLSFSQLVVKILETAE